MGYQRAGQEQQATFWGCDGLQERYDTRANKRVCSSDPGSGYPERDQGGLLSHWLCALRSVCLPHLEACVENGEGDGWQKKMEEPHSLKSNEMAECSFQPQQPLVCDTFKNCEGLSRVAFMDGNGVVMLGKVISCEKKDEADKGGGKKK